MRPDGWLRFVDCPVGTREPSLEHLKFRMDIGNQVQVLARKDVGLEFSLEVIGKISVLVNDALTCAWEVGRGGDRMPSQ